MSGLSGKEKVKFLKSLRESQKIVQINPIQSEAINNPPTPLDSSLNKPVRVVSIPTLIKQQNTPSSAGNTDIQKYLKNAPISNNQTTSLATGLGLVQYDDEDEDEEEIESPKENALDHISSSNSTVLNLPPGDSFDDQPPTGFFDEPIELSLPVQNFNAAITDEEKSRYSGLNDYDGSNKNTNSKVQRVNAADIYTESLLAEAGTDSLIPRGFFDDPLADLRVRGVDIKKIEKKQEKREDDELKSFLGAIEVIKDDDGGVLEQEEEAEEKEKLLEEEMMQLNYERKMAILLHRGHFLHKSRIKNGEKDSDVDNRNEENLKVNEGFDEVKDSIEINDMILIAEKEARELDQQLNDERSDKLSIKKNIDVFTDMDLDVTSEGINDSDNREKTTKLNSRNKGAINVSVEVEQLLRKKKEDKKRKQIEALACDYNPLDFMDWTARSL
eukprot:CAMPEP_0119044310 /NCGR_PEP_ID=MMETSP1177-20130426/30481_1 /TAXON_ID=2985 /ORGANISM="Ochromonas sp, Strain CCMP1899" /LENGTH=442 /DNA_ID=CAMNT_0007014233 /DNA_START=109 /DNA_END=1437 /DNA_ORIENTATION=-